MSGGGERVLSAAICILPCVSSETVLIVDEGCSGNIADSCCSSVG